MVKKTPVEQKAMALEWVEFSVILINDGRRSVDPEKVKQLGESIKEVGLLSPMVVRIASSMMLPSLETGELEEVLGVPALVTGRHRMEALKSLGETGAWCYIFKGDELDAELIEIDENLARNELSPAERAGLLARRKAIYVKKYPETSAKSFHGNRHTGSRRKNCEGQDADRFTAATARATGQSERSIQKDVERGEKLGDDAARIAGTSLDKGVEIDALAKMSAEERKPIIERAEKGEKVTARQPAPKPQPSANVHQFSSEKAKRGAATAGAPEPSAEAQQVWQYADRLVLDELSWLYARIAEKLRSRGKVA